MDEGFGREIDCRAVSGVCVLSWILLVEQLTNNGPTLAHHWSYTEPSLDLLSIISIAAIASIAAGWKDAIARLVFWAEVDKKCFIWTKMCIFANVIYWLIHWVTASGRGWMAAVG